MDLWVPRVVSSDILRGHTTLHLLYANKSTDLARVTEGMDTKAINA